MEGFNSFVRGVVASLRAPALVALGWIYAACVVIAGIFTIFLYRFVSSTVANSTMASDLRHGMSPFWIIDMAGLDFFGPAMALVGTAAMVLIPVFLVVAVFFTGGIVTAVRRALGFAEPETFLSASARFAGPIARVAAVEVIVVVVLAIVLGIGVGATATAGNALAWTWVVVSAFVLAVVTAVFDYVRIGIVASGRRSAAKAFVAALGFVGRRAIPVVILVVLDGLLTLGLWWLVVELHGAISLDSGGGVFLALVVGQIGVLVRLWTRVVSYASETALWEASQVPVAVAAAPAPVPSMVPGD